MEKKNKFQIGDTVLYDISPNDIPYKIEKFKYNEVMNSYEYHIYNPGNVKDELWVNEDHLTLYNANQVFYNTRDWLNPVSSPSTGSIVCFDGITQYSDGTDTNCFIEVSSCHDKARIHKTFADSMDDYINKVEKLQNAITNYLNHLKSKYKNGTN